MALPSAAIKLGPKQSESIELFVEPVNLADGFVEPGVVEC